MLSWEAAQRSQGSKGRTFEKVDVSNAFINSDLPENRLVLIDPPSLLISLGYLPQGAVWVAKRATYGLRESPALWAATRNKEMAKITLDNGLLLRSSKTHAALWLLYHAVDEGVRSGEVPGRRKRGDSNLGRSVPPQDLRQAIGHDRSIRRRYLRSTTGQGNSRLSCRTRPDLAYGASLAASLITRDIDECHTRTRHLVQYLATHLRKDFSTDSEKRGSK